MTTDYPVRVGRVYDEAGPDHGARVLVDRLWPRGLSKQNADLDEWCRDVAPSPELRKWFGHDPERFAEFAERYREELTDAGRETALEHLRNLRQRGPVTLLTATRDTSVSHVTVLADILRAPG